MKKLVVILFLVLLVACQQQVDPTLENANSIFDSKDFTIEFILNEEKTESMSFIDDIIVYKADVNTTRKTISFNQALLINDFIQNQFTQHDQTNSEVPSIAIYNTAKKVTFKIPNYKPEYLELIQKLKL